MRASLPLNFSFISIAGSACARLEEINTSCAAQLATLLRRFIHVRSVHAVCRHAATLAYEQPGGSSGGRSADSRSDAEAIFASFASAGRRVSASLAPPPASAPEGVVVALDGPASAQLDGLLDDAAAVLRHCATYGRHVAARLADAQALLAFTEAQEEAAATPQASASTGGRGESGVRRPRLRRGAAASSEEQLAAAAKVGLAATTARCTRASGRLGWRMRHPSINVTI